MTIAHEEIERRDALWGTIKGIAGLGVLTLGCTYLLFYAPSYYEEIWKFVIGT